MNFAGLELHWIRPELLWTAIPLVICALLLARQHFQQRSWQKHIDPSLLPYLLDGKPSGKPRRSALILLLAAILAWLALLGPAWEKVPSPLHKNTEGLVVVLDLSPSMLAEDIQPSRMRQARFKLRDILHLRRDGQTGLVVFAGDAFIVAPLTDDVNTLLTLIPGLNPSMMPMTGSNPLAGISLAKDLLDRSGGNGSILLISDGVNPQQLSGIRDFISDSDYPLSVLAVGTSDGAPIPLPGGGFARDNNGNIIVPALTVDELQTLAAAGGGVYRELSLDDSDINALSVDTISSVNDKESESRAERNYDQWKDAGPWLVLLLLPFALLGFRKSWLAGLVPLLLPALLVTLPSKANAFEFKDLWQTPDQQAAALLDSDPQAAADKFEDPMWKASAQYRAGDFATAAESYAQFDTADAHYNRGNALAKAGKLDDAIAAYQSALEIDPSLSDAKSNKKIIEDMKENKNQEQSQDGQSQDNKQDSQGDKNQDQQNQNSKNSDSGEQSQSSEDQQPSSPQDDSQDKSQSQDPADSERESDAPASDKQQSDEQQGQSEQNDTEQDQSEQDNNEQQNEQSQAEREAAEQRDAKLAEDYARQAAEQNDAVQKALAAKQAEGAEDKPADQAAAAIASDEPLSEEEQAREQWLRNIPDNPGNLLRNKFRYQHLDRQQRGEQQGNNDDYAPY
ncbi:VWA domain-containing protein [Zhongshania arctica]|uniref:VWA domain-containing protein n=1 Tax=Zhongshania arctica TaxID=3238302 RepID=A0ABV3U100_9GAMM